MTLTAGTECVFAKAQAIVIYMAIRVKSRAFRSEPIQFNCILLQGCEEAPKRFILKW